MNVKSVMNSFATYVCEMHIILLSALFCNARSAAEQAARMSRPFAPPGVYLSDHFLVI